MQRLRTPNFVCLEFGSKIVCVITGKGGLLINVMANYIEINLHNAWHCKKKS